MKAHAVTLASVFCLGLLLTPTSHGEAVNGVVRDLLTHEGIPGVTVELLNYVTGSVVATTVSGSNGAYSVQATDSYTFLIVRFGRSEYDAYELSRFYAPFEFNVLLVPSVPGVPKGLTASGTRGKVMLRWVGNTEADWAGYNVYRRSGEAGGFERVNATLVSDTRYYDVVANDGFYFYQVSAVDTEGHESPPTEAVEAYAGTVRVWSSDTAARPGKLVRIPVNVDDANGISPNGIHIDFRYDPGILDASAMGVEVTAITKQVVVSTDTSVAGRVLIEGAGVAGELKGEGHLFDIRGRVRSDASLNSCGATSFAEAQLLDAENVTLSTDLQGGSVCAKTTFIQGDLNGDGLVTDADAIIALQVTTRKLDANDFSLAVGDLNGDGRIDSADAVMILRLAAGEAVNPAAPDAAEPKALGCGENSSGVHISFGSAAVEEGGSVAIPVTIDDASALSGFNATISFPPDAYRLELYAIEAGTLTRDFTLDTNTDNAELGYVTIGMCRQDALSSTKSSLGGSLAVLHFQLKSQAHDGDLFRLGINEVKLSGEYGEDFSWETTIGKSQGRIVVGDILCGAASTIVLDAGTLAPVGDATVRITPSVVNPLTSNTNGVYTFPCLPPGTYTVSVSASGYDASDVQAVVCGGADAVVEVRLRAAGENDPGCAGGTVRRDSPRGSMWGLATLGVVSLVIGSGPFTRRYSRR